MAEQEQQNVGLGAALVAALLTLEALPPLEPPPWYDLVNLIEDLDITIGEAVDDTALQARFACGHLKTLPAINQPLITAAQQLRPTPIQASHLPDGW